MEDQLAMYYLRDLGLLIREKAFEAKATKDQTNDPFDIGRLAAYHEVVSLMLSQADQFRLGAESVRLEGVDPDRDLL
jgi:hypothetical protein